MSEAFVPEKPEAVPEGYRTDEIHTLYADAWEDGIWVKEWKGEVGFIAAAGSIYQLQRFEHEHPEVGDLDPQEFSISECMSISYPGGGETREDAIRAAVTGFKTSMLMVQHAADHEMALSV